MPPSFLPFFLFDKYYRLWTRLFVLVSWSVGWLFSCQKQILVKFTGLLCLRK